MVQKLQTMLTTVFSPAFAATLPDADDVSLFRSLPEDSEPASVRLTWASYSVVVYPSSAHGPNELWIESAGLTGQQLTAFQKKLRKDMAQVCAL
eukprot:m.332673 g.332673  ORF g.332673 m.332673 type:complete len:94 (+) comp79800_c0_seq1:117-398(+)